MNDVFMVLCRSVQCREQTEQGWGTGSPRMAHSLLSAPREGGPAPLQREMGAELVPAAAQMLLEPSGKW